MSKLQWSDKDFFPLRKSLEDSHYSGRFKPALKEIIFNNFSILKFEPERVQGWFDFIELFDDIMSTDIKKIEDKLKAKGD